MPRNTPSQKGSGKASGSNKTLPLLLAGFTAVVIVVIALVAVLSTTGGQNADNFTANDQGLLEVGSQAPDFTAETVDGGTVSLGGGEGAPALLVFFWTDCPACNEEAPIISDLEDQYEELQVVMVGIDGRDTPETVEEFSENYDIQGPTVYEPSLGSDYNVSAYPTSYFVGSSGEIIAAHTGTAPRETMQDWTEEALAS